MENSQNIKLQVLKKELINVLEEVNNVNFESGHGKFEEIIIGQKGLIDISEIRSLILEIFNQRDWSAEQDEIISDMSSRLNGFCSPKREINW